VTRSVIRWRDLDAYGHVNYSVYLDYLAEERTRMLGLGELWEYVIVELTIRYRSEVRFADGYVETTCEIVRIGNKSVTTREELRAPDGRLAVESEAVLVGFDLEARQSVEMPDHVRAELERRMRDGF
jgi:acyl-CoA thioester hydrolase